MPPAAKTLLKKGSGLSKLFYTWCGRCNLHVAAMPVESVRDSAPPVYR
jgi:hypothetical protein